MILVRRGEAWDWSRPGSIGVISTTADSTSAPARRRREEQERNPHGARGTGRIPRGAHVAGARRDALGHFPLQHQDEPFGPRRGPQEAVQDGAGDVVRNVGHHFVWRLPSAPRSSGREMSPWTSLKPPGFDRSGLGARQTQGEAPVKLHGRDPCAASSRPLVRIPRPGPTSRTRRPGSGAARSRMDCSTSGSARKFWDMEWWRARPSTRSWRRTESGSSRGALRVRNVRLAHRPGSGSDGLGVTRSETGASAGSPSPQCRRTDHSLRCRCRARPRKQPGGNRPRPAPSARPIPQHAVRGDRRHPEPRTWPRAAGQPAGSGNQHIHHGFLETV